MNGKNKKKCRQIQIIVSLKQNENKTNIIYSNDDRIKAELMTKENHQNVR